MPNPNLHCEKCDVNNNSFVHYIPENQLELFNEVRSCQKYKKGQDIFFENSHPLGMFCVNEGKIKIYKTGVNGKEQIIYFAKSVDFIGYHALITGEKYNISAAAIEESVVCFIPHFF